MNNHLKEPQIHKPSGFRRAGSSFVFIVAMALLGFLAQFQWIGHIVIVLYVAVALLTRRSASEMFTLALISLGVVPVAIILANWLIAQNFAAYSFMFFVFGMVAMTAELQREIKARK
ncbi:MAG TPA: hypothetical protein VK502_00855 [Candidatus Saccharimonadales bacterium]|nr:hypothetical protein [Candidatus Saccharimonadales bacterium]